MEMILMSYQLEDSLDDLFERGWYIYILDGNIRSAFPSFDYLEQKYDAARPFAALPMIRSNVEYRTLTPEERERFIEKLKML